MTEPCKPKTISIDGEIYVRQADFEQAKAVNGMPFVIVRTRSAGVFAGYLKSRSAQEVIMVNARRLWYWSGAASLSQLSIDGTAKPKECKFPAPVTEIWLPEAIEVISCSAKAQQSIEEVSIWKA